MLGARPEPSEALVAPVNALERERDPDGTWRAHVNAALAGPYRALFGRLDLFVLFTAPDFATVLAWRREAAKLLRRRLAEARAGCGPRHERRGGRRLRPALRAPDAPHRPRGARPRRPGDRPRRRPPFVDHLTCHSVARHGVALDVVWPHLGLHQCWFRFVGETTSPSRRPSGAFGS